MGGLGTRLGALTRDTPKPLLEVNGRAFLAWVMHTVLPYGIEEFVLLTGHLADRVEQRMAALAADLPRPVKISLSKEPAPAGTGGALYHARSMLEDRFVLLNGDSLFLADLRPALGAFTADLGNVACRMVLREIEDARRYGVATLDGERVMAFSERPNSSGPGLINSGIYLMQRRLADRAVPGCSLERDLLPELVAEGMVRGTVAAGWFIDIGVPADLDRARKELPTRVRKLG